MRWPFVDRIADFMFGVDRFQSMVNQLHSSFQFLNRRGMIQQDLAEPLEVPLKVHYCGFQIHKSIGRLRQSEVPCLVVLELSYLRRLLWRRITSLSLPGERLMARWQNSLAEAETHLRQRDRRLRAVIDQVGPCTLKLDRNRYRMLVRSIVSQQISSKAAQSILQRIESVVGKTYEPQQFANLDLESLRSLGVSPQKGRYVQDLTEHVLDGRLNLSRLGRLTDDEVIEQLVVVKGIGHWTAQMFLIFSLGRLDVLPGLDLGVRKGIARIHDLPEVPAPAECEQFAAGWRPFASIASWYCWRANELPTVSTS